MLSLSKKTDYALLALSHLARSGSGHAANTKEIAEQYDIPVEMLAKILQKLAKARLITSTAGPTGGYRLARPAAEITVAAAIEAVDGPPAIAQCMKQDANRCEQLGKCTIRKPLTRINMRILQMLSLITLAEISDDSPDESAYPILKLSRRHNAEPASIV
jgi:Rrf2 family iron-sulfur cluster assembly transcriptional regulator